MNRKGNRNWAARGGYHKFWIPEKPTMFEQLQQKLGLTDQQVPYSIPMRDWAARNRKIRYVPEELLIFWGLDFAWHESLWGVEEEILANRRRREKVRVRKETKSSQTVGLPSNADPGAVPLPEVAISSLP